MKTLLICKSYHHGNTNKVAKVMAKVLKARILAPEKATPRIISKYDLIGFGSGIYFFKHHKSLFELLEKLPKMKKKAFVFSTRGGELSSDYHKSLRKELSEKGFKIIGEFTCKAWDSFGPMGLVGGINKGRPNEKDLKKARDFAARLVSKR